MSQRGGGRSCWRLVHKGGEQRVFKVVTPLLELGGCNQKEEKRGFTVGCGALGMGVESLGSNREA